jgi:peptidase M23B
MRKYLTTILTIVTISVTSICVYAENITDLQEKSNQINQSITETNNRLQAVQEQMSENMQQLQELDTQLAQSEEELNKINIEVSTLTTQISENEQKLSNAQEKYDKIKKVLDARVIEIYKSDNLQLLGVLFASKNVKEFFQTYDKLILLSKYDKTLLDSAEQQIEEIEVTKKILAEKKKQIVESKQLQQKKTQVVQNSKTKRQYYLSKLTKQEQELQAQIDEYNTQVTQIENEIKLLALGSIGEDYVGGTLVWPVPGRTSLTSLYGMRVHPITGAYKLHTGIDISAPLGTYFVAAANGVVSKATYNTAYGNMVIIDHGGGVQTLYAHGNSILVQVGDEVKAGTPVLEVGSTGYSTGPHAHFEIRINGQTVNPLDYYKNKNSITSSATKEDDENKTESTESN